MSWISFFKPFSNFLVSSKREKVELIGITAAAVGDLLEMVLDAIHKRNQAFDFVSAITPFGLFTVSTLLSMCIKGNRTGSRVGDSAFSCLGVGAYLASRTMIDLVLLYLIGDRIAPPSKEDQIINAIQLTLELLYFGMVYYDEKIKNCLDQCLPPPDIENGVGNGGGADYKVAA